MKLNYIFKGTVDEIYSDFSFTEGHEPIQNFNILELFRPRLHEPTSSFEK